MRQLPNHWFTPAPHWFHDDGCSGVPEFDNTTRCACRQHDWRYFLGGGAPEKLRADRALRDDIKAHSGLRPWLRAWSWYFGLRLLSQPWLGWFAISKKRFHFGRDRLTMPLHALYRLHRTLRGKT